MTDRRTKSRFFVPDAAEATLRLMQDVWVERVNPRAVVAISDRPVREREALVLELPSECRSRSVVRVVVETVDAVTAGDRRRFRLGLRIPSTDRPAPRAAGQGPASGHLPALGVIVRQVQVRVHDVSVSGCQLESPDAVPDGAIALLEFALEQGRHVESIRICRVARHAGRARPWRAGAQFLALGAPPPASVRNLVARFEIIDELGQDRSLPSGRPGEPLPLLTSPAIG